MPFLCYQLVSRNPQARDSFKNITVWGKVAREPPKGANQNVSYTYGHVGILHVYPLEAPLIVALNNLLVHLLGRASETTGRKLKPAVMVEQGWIDIT